LIIGGPNGAGKTTFAVSAAREWSLRYLGADLIAETLGLGSRGSDAVRAGRVFTETVRAAIASRESLLVESTLSGLGAGRLMCRARDAGYRVSVGFVFVDSADTCIARIRTRVLKGGHSVPDGDVRRRFRRSLLNFWERYRLDADRWHLTYNGGVDARPRTRCIRALAPHIGGLMSSRPTAVTKVDTGLEAETVHESAEMGRIFRQAVRDAREENRRRGVPNVQVDEQGRLSEELPDGTVRLIQPK